MQPTRGQLPHDSKPLMEKTGLVILLLFAQLTPSLGTTREYHLIKMNKSWTEAQKYCREHFDDLATIETEEEWERVKKLMGVANKDVWIGLHHEFNNWKWSINSQYINAEWENWVTFRRDNITGKDFCVLVRDGILYDDPCVDQHRSMCYNEINNTFIAIENLTSFWEAQSYCRRKYTDLAPMRNSTKRGKIMNLTKTYVLYWIGLSRETWKWSDQSNYWLSWWMPGQPNGTGYEGCAAAGQKGWYDTACNTETPFICSGLSNYTVTFKITLKAKEEKNMNDPRVQEDILKQLEKRLKDLGINQVTMTWKKKPTEKVCDEDDKN